jgi:hypothetical protein
MRYNNEQTAIMNRYNNAISFLEMAKKDTIKGDLKSAEKMLSEMEYQIELIRKYHINKKE